MPLCSRLGAARGDRVRIPTQPIDARTDQHLWTRSFDRDLRNVLVLQSEVAPWSAGWASAVDQG
jgi:TolB-like protein